jgi:hypothetical protein
VDNNSLKRESMLITSKLQSCFRPSLPKAKDTCGSGVNLLEYRLESKIGEIMKHLKKSKRRFVANRITNVG